MTPRLKLDVGDRVSRQAIHYLTDPALPDRTGTVVDAYHSAPSLGATVDAWLRYAVKWDDTGVVTRDYIREGLTKL